MEQGNLHISKSYAFLFDGSIKGLPYPPLAYFTGELLLALRLVDHLGRTKSQLRVGMPILHSFAAKTSGVHSTQRSKGQTVSYDKDIYKHVICEWLNSIGEDWHTIQQEYGLNCLMQRTSECISLSSLDDDIRDAINTKLKDVSGYVGAFTIDPANPIHRNGFFNSLIYAAAIENGTVIQELSCDGEEEWPLEGSGQFRPGGLIWKQPGWLNQFGPAGLARQITSERGKKSALILARKRQLTIEERVLKELSEMRFLNVNLKEFEFNSVTQTSDILQAIMPEAKFTKYLFDRSSEKGRPKATFLIDILGISPEDWRYLAAQFYFGLLIAKPEDIEFKEWRTGYNVRFNVTMRIRSRSGKNAVLVSGWNMEPGKLPSLSTAKPGPHNANVIEPDNPPILLPGSRGNTEWSQLWMWANEAGIREADSHVPTPMFLSGMDPMSEGDCGSAFVRIGDARRGFARWLKREGLGVSDGHGGTIVFCPILTQSFERANVWARAVALIVKLNGIKAEVQSYYT